MRWTETPPLPSELQLEITSACNLRCAMCLVRYRPPVNKVGALPYDLFAPDRGRGAAAAPADVAGAGRAGPASGPGCTWPWDSAYVTSAGVVQPCRMVMGDLRESTFEEVWYGRAYREFRRRLAAGTDIPAVCEGCALYQRTL